MKCLDSSILIDFLKGNDEAVTKIEKMNSNSICSTIVNLIEVASGIYRKKDIDHKKHIDRMKILFNELYLLNFNYNSALLSAKINADLVKEGKEIDANDCSIAGIMLTSGCNTVITRDKEHFERIKGIKVESY
ncbi:MAG: type II toxin-antitoxin system VapC family toxin [Nanoarchaeota archaeon]|nr:type II toxin-antitoxin system VapC family toxin [Nanoarchaeota archaeon]